MLPRCESFPTRPIDSEESLVIESVSYFVDIDKLTLKFTWREKKRLRRVKPALK